MAYIRFCAINHLLSELDYFRILVDFIEVHHHIPISTGLPILIVLLVPDATYGMTLSSLHRCLFKKFYGNCLLIIGRIDNLLDL
jgi:hypothetical protein